MLQPLEGTKNYYIQYYTPTADTYNLSRCYTVNCIVADKR